MTSFLFITLILGLQATIQVQSTCFTPNGTDRNTLADATVGTYMPCDPFAAASMCCRVGLDLCVHGNTLCYNNVSQHYWRESCTDSTWQDPACTKLFMNGTGLNSTVGTMRDDQGNVDADALVTACDDGSWCSGGDNRGCCQAGQGVFILNGEQVDQNPSATSTSSVTSSTSTSSPTTSSWTQSPTMTAPSPLSTVSQSSSGLSTGAKAAIGVCVALGCISFLAIGAWWIFRRSRKHQQQHPPPPEGHYAPALEIGSEYKSTNTDELEASPIQEKRASEMDARHVPQELPVSRD